MQTIYLDISNKGIIPTIYAKQGDVRRKFLVVLTDAGIPYSPPAGSVFSVWYDGDSGEGNYTDIGEKTAFSINENKVEVELITQMLGVPGEGVLCLVLNGADGSQIASWNINYLVESVPGANSEQAKDYYTAFSRAVENLPYPDASLSVPGKAADAAAVGAALNGITPEKIGAAPAGYGLGTQNEVIITSLSELDNTYLNGWYKFQTFNEENIEGHQLGLLYVNSSTGSIEQIFVPYRKPYRLIRVNHAEDGWGAWEYENPPMIIGVEYRTTERWNGEPIYAVSIDYGWLPNNQWKYTMFRPDRNPTRILSHTISLYNEQVLEICDDNAHITEDNVGESGGALVCNIVTNADMSMFSAVFTVKYLK
jgi:hypothetical protein